MRDCYIAIMEVLKRVELSIRGDSNSKFKYMQYENYKDDIEKEIKNTKIIMIKISKEILVRKI